MCLYSEAIKHLSASSTCKIIAPSGAWDTSKAKEQWIKALANARYTKRFFIAGEGYNKETKDIVKKRAEYLSNNGVEVKIMASTPEHNTGVIIFDKVAFLGISINNEVRLIETNIPSHISTLNNLFEDAVRVSDAYR